jgi:hypothetical protein
VQAALAEVILPELQSLFGQDAVQVMSMMMESLAGEWDTAAQDLDSDNRALGELLSQAGSAISSLAQSNPSPEGRAALVKEIESVLGEAPAESLALSVLGARNSRLKGAMERVLVELEDAAGWPGMESLDAVRQAVYQHLRQVALRGWSFWDVASFRERMVRARTEAIT